MHKEICARYKQVGAAFVHIQGDIPICRSVHPLPLYWDIFDAELYGAYEALRYATTLYCPPPAIYLHLDNQVALYTMVHPSVSSSAFTICKVIETILFLKTNNTEVHIGWTLGYIGIIRNKLAQKVAQYAASLPCNQLYPWTPTSIHPNLRARLVQD
jgi:hypothetical protein